MKRRAKFFTYWVLLAAVALAMQLTAAAQDAPSSAAQEDPPTRVARLNFMQGSVSFQPGGEGDWVTAVPNRPLTTGDNFLVGR